MDLSFKKKEPELASARLQQLSDEVNRIAATLSRLAITPGSPAQSDRAVGPKPPTVSIETVRNVIKARRMRAKYFEEDLFADPAWDIMLDLLQAEIVQHRVSVSSLCTAAAVPPTTALRWITSMTDRGLLQRRHDPHDRRRVFVELSPSASLGIRRYFAELGSIVI